MYSEETKNRWKLDARTELILLFMANIIAFTQRSVVIEISWFIVLAIILLLNRCIAATIKCSVCFFIFLVLQYYIFPNAPLIVTSCFLIIVSYARKIFPCILMGILIVKKTSVREVMQALRSWHIPQQLIIPLSVTIRYFPAIKEEIVYIRDAMKLRNIGGIKKLQYYIVPIIISATTAADELSAAAVTRGIENPCKKTNLCDLKMSFIDWFILLIGLFFIFAAIIVRG